MENECDCGIDILCVASDFLQDLTGLEDSFSFLNGRKKTGYEHRMRISGGLKTLLSLQAVSKYLL